MEVGDGPYERNAKRDSWKTVLTLAFQSLGVVYGELSTSPLYVYKSTFEEDIEHSESNEEIYGVLSFIFWTLTLIPLIKYVFIVLRADDNGEGGTFALYSLLCRCARISSIPNGQLADEELSEYRPDVHGSSSRDSETSSKLKLALEKHKFLQKGLLFLALFGTSMVIGDGVLTPANSVISAVSGLQLFIAKEIHQSIELPIVCFILVVLFALQHYGTHKVGFIFAPVVLTWLLCISALGLYNIIHWNPHIYQALSPHYMYKFFKKTKRKGWTSLCGILLCITGSEAMFADLGHFSHLSIQIAFTFVVYPSLILAYMGQAAYLSKHHLIESYYKIGFYISVPENMRVPVFAIAVLAAVVGSQAIITGTFSIIKQCSAMGFFPRTKIIHTSSKMHGQIYIPEINWILMILCLSVTLGFRDTKHVSNASGLAVITVMLVTTCLMPLVIVICWEKKTILALSFFLVFFAIEALYFSASVTKFLEGAWVPIVLSLIFLMIMYVWHYGTLKKYRFDEQNKVAIDWFFGLGHSLGIARVPGIGLIHTELVTGIPASFSHFVTNLPAFHQVVVFLCVKSLPLPRVRPEERFLVGRVGPKEYRMYRCIARYGYRDFHKDDLEFEDDLICSIAEFLNSENEEASSTESPNVDERMSVVGTSSTKVYEEGENEVENGTARREKRVRFLVPETPIMKMETREELQELKDAKEAGTAFILGHSYVRARKGSWWLKKVAINYGYDFLRRNTRGPSHAMGMSHASTIEVGMICDV